MKGNVVITGGGSGIGAATALRLAKQGYHVIIVGRERNKLTEVQSQHENIESLPADIRYPECGQSILDAVAKHGACQYLIHSATTVDPIGTLHRISRQQWQTISENNIEGPLFLTQTLLPTLTNGRVLFISSRLAHIPCPGLGAHCVTKAAMHMIYQVLAGELQGQNIGVGSLHPGVVDTPLQATLRNSSPADLPVARLFVELKDNNLLLRSSDAAAFIDWVLTKTSDDQFIEKEWNIYDKSHHEQWMEQPISEAALSVETS